MNEDAQAALLKTLEETAAGHDDRPVCRYEEPLLPTIRSRCARSGSARSGSATSKPFSTRSVSPSRRSRRVRPGSPWSPGRGHRLGPHARGDARARCHRRTLMDLAEARPAERLVGVCAPLLQAPGPSPRSRQARTGRPRRRRRPDRPLPPEPNEAGNARRLPRPCLRMQARTTRGPTTSGRSGPRRSNVVARRRRSWRSGPMSCATSPFASAGWSGRSATRRCSMTRGCSRRDLTRRPSPRSSTGSGRPPCSSPATCRPS